MWKRHSIPKLTENKFGCLQREQILLIYGRLSIWGADWLSATSYTERKRTAKLVSLHSSIPALETNHKSKL